VQIDWNGEKEGGKSRRRKKKQRRGENRGAKNARKVSWIKGYSLTSYEIFEQPDLAEQSGIQEGKE
jgi:hypothetical protein